MASYGVPPERGAYGAESEPADFIAGITFEIWEQRGVELIRQYYAPDCVVYGLDGLVLGAQAMVRGTYDYLEAFPDRRLLADAVIWSRDQPGQFHSSHRIDSPMTNLGPSAFGPATGNSVRVAAIADCWVEQGVITREWLVRDGLALVKQLGFDALPAARRLHRERDQVTSDWLQAEFKRAGRDPNCDHELASYARQVLSNCWRDGGLADAESPYAPYAVLHRSPRERHSGTDAIEAHFAALRAAFGDVRIAVDHIAAQPWGHSGQDIAVRWGLAVRHRGAFEGAPIDGRPAYILGVSHWRVVEGRIAVDWTLFDGLGVLAQLVPKAGAGQPRALG